VFSYVGSNPSVNPSRPFHPRFLPAQAVSPATVTDMWACIFRGPHVSEGILVASCVSEIGGERDAVATCGSAR
jgi:hypothetical protein